MADLGSIESWKKRVYDKQTENTIPKGRDNVGSRKELNKHKTLAFSKKLKNYIYNMKAGCF